ncbi:hypothetical protein Ae406Ps2_4875 [Pseudonocardia sp. Ae406_Ps2]|nr:hypothetical protein Ae331Ps2_1080c [Pseudonocardia sp. Ae331_Ps2]OLM04875.1 hypothetical protein Ae406Ps2_4875 [Pseudonocardia sp. Ae406_Ps2]OLM10293.1 hypothetical protein Ae505Ps2_0415c [Pseudonocardia sp. Ae505_Ps2]OLM26447.1 hypothetical protein Ae706Ps2_4880 [Pseudonocardia sp. Ae706_Ps2]
MVGGVGPPRGAGAAPMPSEASGRGAETVVGGPVS